MPTTPSHPEAPARRRFLGQPRCWAPPCLGWPPPGTEDAGGGSPQHRATAQPTVGRSGPAARAVISISMQFEAGAQPERGASGPFPPLDPRYPDYPVRTRYAYGVREGIPRLLDLWERTGSR